MRHGVAGEVRSRLGYWSSYELVTDRRGTQVWRFRLINGASVAVKIADGDGDARVLPMREAAVIWAAGPVAGRVLAFGRLPDGGSWMATAWWHGPTLRAKFAPVRRIPDAPAARHFAAAAAAEAAAAVAALHEIGWAHGDLQADRFLRPARRGLLVGTVEGDDGLDLYVVDTANARSARRASATRPQPERRGRTATIRGPHLNGRQPPATTTKGQDAPPSGPWNPTPRSGHATARPDRHGDITGSQPPTTTRSALGRIKVEARKGSHTDPSRRCPFISP